MKYYIIAGERSGDLHASNLMKGILENDSLAEFRFWGGDEMQKVGGTLVKHYKDLAFMGFLEVIRNLGTILGFIRFCKKDITAYHPDVVILVDYAGFNMRIAKFTKKNNLKTFYYISPKVWAWNTKRAFNIKKLIDRMFVIFPFEKDFYKKFDYEVDYVGNPLLDAIHNFIPNPDFKKENNLTDLPIVALLPGSRHQEVSKMLSLMLGIKDHFKEYQFVIAAVSNLPKEFYTPYQNIPNVKVVFEQTYDLLSIADLALVTSGTATLETALFEVPQVVCYKTSNFTYQIIKRLIKVKYISLVNLVAQKEVVKELIQKELDAENLTAELIKIQEGKPKNLEIKQGYKEIKLLLGEAGASQRAGKKMVDYLK